jgi:hypothetical protein
MKGSAAMAADPFIVVGSSTQAFLVSQKIAAISSILPRS